MLVAVYGIRVAAEQEVKKITKNENVGNIDRPLKKISICQTRGHKKKRDVTRMHKKRNICTTRWCLQDTATCNCSEREAPCIAAGLPVKVSAPFSSHDFLCGRHVLKENP
jgi:hypothetical protein